jgi:hypothetical protein
MRKLLFITLLMLNSLSQVEARPEPLTESPSFYDNETKICLQGSLEKHDFEFFDKVNNVSIQFKLKLDHQVGLRQDYEGENFFSSSNKVVLTSDTALKNQLQKAFEKKQTVRLCGAIRFPEASPEGQDSAVLDLR